MAADIFLQNFYQRKRTVYVYLYFKLYFYFSWWIGHYPYNQKWRVIGFKNNIFKSRGSELCIPKHNSCKVRNSERDKLMNVIKGRYYKPWLLVRRRTVILFNSPLNWYPGFIIPTLRINEITPSKAALAKYVIIWVLKYFL